MKSPLHYIKTFVRKLGPVEQAQIVASTAVIVSMTTIISAMAATGQTPRLMDFISILTIGIIGFTSVYFSLYYSRELDEQRRQLLALNMIAEAVTRVVDLDYVLQTALTRATELLNSGFGWIYLVQDDKLLLRCSKGTSEDFFALHGSAMLPVSHWLNQPTVQRERLDDEQRLISAALKQMGIQFWASIPLRMKDAAAGTLIVAGKDFEMFTSKQAELMEAFGNQISVALNNAHLFEQLRQSQQQYADLFENAPDIYLSVDSGHIVVGCNKTGTDILGYAREDVIGKEFESFFIAPRQNVMRETLDRMFTEGRALKDVEEQMVTRFGRQFFVHLNSSLVFDDRGKTINARIVARDISERKMMEGAILHAQKIDSIGNLAGGIAHDFNNILAAILGSASIMRRHLAEKSKLYKYVDIVESSARRGSSLTRQLLTFARKTERFVKPVQINTLIEETLQLFQRSVSKDIVVQTALTPDSTSVNGDDGQLQQALLNLFLNARDAMPSGGTLTVSTDVTLADGHTTSQFTSVKAGPFVVIRVADTGVGIDKSLQNRVFEPFFTTKDRGTGLGLSVVYGVAQSHGGFINLESEVGTGTTMTLYLPRVVTAVPPHRQKRQRIARGSENILIIDDEVSVCEIARDMLTSLGYTVYTEHDGKAGVDMYSIHQATIDLILLDINMPVLGGKDTFEILRSINSRCRIIIVTGYGRGVIETSMFSGNVDGFMEKPFQIETLAAKVREVLDQKSPRVEHAADKS